MNYILLMESWRKFITENKQLCEQGPGIMPGMTISAGGGEEDEKDQDFTELDKKEDAIWNIITIADNRNLKKTELEFLRNWIKTTPDQLLKKGGRYNDVYEAALETLQSEEQDQTFKSDSFSLKNIQKEDPELARAITVFMKKDINQSNLLFDGAKLHWRIGEEIIYSWNASSGHFEDDILEPGGRRRFDDIAGGRLSKAALTMAKKIKAKAAVVRNDDGSLGTKADKFRAILSIINVDPLEKSEDYTRERLMDDLNELVDAVEREMELVIKYREMLERFKNEPKSTISNEVKEEFSAIKKDYYDTNIKVKNIIKTYVELTLGADKYYETSKDKRTIKQNIEDFGPTPEGKYLIQSRLQDLTNQMSSNFFSRVLAMSAVATGELDKSDMFTINRFFVNDPYANQGNFAWGKYRVRISKIVKKDTTKNWKDLKAYKGKRDGFFIHGGDFRGSSGCIDLGDEMESFAKFWTVGGIAKAMGKNVKRTLKHHKIAKLKGEKEYSSYWDEGGRRIGKISIPLFVEYIDPVKDKLVAKNPIAKRFADYIFGSLKDISQKYTNRNDGAVSSRARNL